MLQRAEIEARARYALLAELRRREQEKSQYDWQQRARPNQLPPSGDWRTWLLLAGRGFGKTRTAAEWVRSLAESGRGKRIGLIGRTAADTRDVMIEGESGLLSICPPHLRPRYEPSKRRITWPNGSIATAYSAEEPDMLRGPQHDFLWADEVCAWQRPDTCWDMAMMGLRLGIAPQVCVSTTPRPIKLIKRLIADATTRLVRGSTYDNAANLAPAYLDAVKSRYEGTRLGRQELLAEVLDDNPRALWKRDLIEELRVDAAPALKRIVVAIDPAVTANPNSDETGIIVAGVDAKNIAYVLEDLSLRATPEVWARTAVDAYHRHSADRIIAEGNNGGDLVESVLRQVDRTIAFRKVSASRGKILRAEPVAAMYEKKCVHHVRAFPLLEDQMAEFDGAQDYSPDRLDALVYALTELLGGGNTGLLDFYRNAAVAKT